MSMQFGDEAFLANLRASQTETGTIQYDSIYPVVDAVARPFVRKRLHGRDVEQEEVLQEVHLAVWQGLPQFLEQAEHNVPRQRLGWLYQICSNKLNDAFRTMKRRDDRESELDDALPDNSKIPELSLVREDLHREDQALVDNLLRTACSLRSRPETKLAFLYNRVVMPLATGHARKGDAKAVLTLLENRPLGEIRSRLSRDLEQVLDRPVPGEVFVGLDKSLRGREHEPFHLTERQVATASYSVCATLAAEREFAAGYDAGGIILPFFTFLRKKFDDLPLIPIHLYTRRPFRACVGRVEMVS